MASERTPAFLLRRLARRAASGDARAFRSLYRALHPTVHAYFAARTSDIADAEDFTAEVFHRVVQRIATYDPERGSPRAWVVSIARNLFIDALRAAPANATPITDVEARLADASLLDAEDDEHRQRLRAALADYEPRVREMFALRYGDGLRVREVAQVLGESEAAVKQRFARTLRELKARLAAPKEVVHAL